MFDTENQAIYTLEEYFNNKDEKFNSDGMNELWNMQNKIISNNEYYVIKENNKKKSFFLPFKENISNRSRFMYANVAKKLFLLLIHRIDNEHVAQENGLEKNSY